MLFDIQQSILISTKALRANKARSFLTMLGIIIGVGAVILIMSLGAGAQSLILDQVKTLGSNTISITPGKSEKNEPPTFVMGVVITTLTYDDLKAIRNKIKNIVGASAYVQSNGTLSWQDNAYDTTINGTTASYLQVEGGNLANGRFFTVDEEENLAKVAVLGSTAKKELFGESDALGQKFKIGKQVFEVIGIMESRGKVAFQDYDDQIIIPIRSAQKLIAGINYLNYIRVRVNSSDNINEVISEITSLIRDQHDIRNQNGQDDDFTVRDAAQAIDMLKSITDALRYFLAAMAALSLLVGGIGIMNIMLISVNERTREIGLRKAVGARNKNISFQFLFEAITLTLIGGLIGIIFGILLSFLASVIINYLGYNWSFKISFSAIILGISVSAIIGLIFGWYPARRASKLSPVNALSYE
ncbi:MAG: ABC transporter permease [Planctomycetes bacterium]|jgi:putative ABC transport system permease protein|nr:ABC transporter permease [Planctomycetota bacterium]